MAGIRASLDEAMSRAVAAYSPGCSGDVVPSDWFSRNGAIAAAVHRTGGNLTAL